MNHPLYEQAIDQLMQVCEDQLDQSATHDGLENCDLLAKIRWMRREDHQPQDDRVDIDYLLERLIWIHAAFDKPDEKQHTQKWIKELIDELFHNRGINAHYNARLNERLESFGSEENE
jgi:hypothetical protein